MTNASQINNEAHIIIASHEEPEAHAKSASHRLSEDEKKRLFVALLKRAEGEYMFEVKCVDCDKPAEYFYKGTSYCKKHWEEERKRIRETQEEVEVLIKQLRKQIESVLGKKLFP